MKKHIHIQTAIPGPKSKAITARRNEAAGRAISHSIPIAIASAHGALVTDVDGNTFIDFAGAIGTMNVGHTPLHVMQAAHDQMQKLIHTCFAVALYEPYIELAEAINRISPGNHAKKTMFFNSGAEAIENAIKMARRYTGCRGVVSFERGFHGRTYMALSLTRKIKPYKTHIGPFMNDTYHWPYPDYQHTNGLTPDQLDDYMLEQIRRSFLTEVDPRDIACVVMEPIQGEGGFIVPSQKFMQGIRDICDEHHIILIIDEIQSGFGRTGKFFAIEHFGIMPDLITMSKSIAAGFPLSAVCGRAEIVDAPEPGELGGTYGGSPVSCAAALAVIQMIENENLLERSAELGTFVINRLEAIKNLSTCISDVRGVGSMIAIEFADPITKAPDAERVKRILTYAYEHGLMLLSAGLYGNVIRLLYPLVITDEQMQEALGVLEEAILQA